MAIVTTYVCDVSGVSGVKQSDFVSISIRADNSKIPGMGYSQREFIVNKLVHIDVARKLNLVFTNKDEEVQPEVTFESKLATLLKDYIEEIAYEAGAEAGYNARQN